MQGLIRSSEQRVVKERKTSEAARVRAFRQNAALVTLGLFLVGSFALTNIILLESVLRSPIGGTADEVSASRMGPLLQERLRRQAKQGGSGGVRGAVDKTWAAAARHYDRVKSWVKGSPKVEEEAMDLDRQERAKLQAMHDALLGHNASSGNASQALKQALGLVPVADTGQLQQAGALRGTSAAGTETAGAKAPRGATAADTDAAGAEASGT